MNIDFNYFVKRAEVITEMARPSTMFGRNPAVQKGIVDARKTLLLNHGYPQGGGLDLALFRYIFNLLEEYGLVTPEIDKTYHSLSGRREVGNYLPHLVVKMLDDGGLDINRFVKDLSNSEKIDEFANEVLKPGRGGRAIGKERHVKELTDIDKNDLDRMRAELFPIVTAMNREMGGRKISRTRRGEKSDYAKFANVPDSSEEEDNSLTFLYFVLDAIEVLLHQNPNQPILKTVEAPYRARLDAGKPISRDGFFNKLQGWLDNPQIRGTSSEKSLRNLAREVKELESDVADYDNPETALGQLRNALENSDIKGVEKLYDKDLFSKYINTPELKQKFLEWLQAENKLKEYNAIALDTREVNKAIEDSRFEADAPKYQMSDELRNVRKAKDYAERNLNSPDPNKVAQAEAKLQELDELEQELMNAGHHMRPVDGEQSKTGMDNPITRQLKGLLYRVSYIEKELQKPDLTPEYRAEIEQELSQKRAQIAELEGQESSSNPEFEPEESPYMSEQIKKDKKFSRKKPLLLENNYKKFKNYHHWLTFNS